MSSKKEDIKDKYDSSTSEEILISIVNCLDSILLPSLDLCEKNQPYEDILLLIANRLLEALYSDELQFHNLNFLVIALSLLHKIAQSFLNWIEEHIGDLLGIAKAYIHYGLAGLPQIKPQKVHLSQQSVLDPAGGIEFANSEKRGGKIAKTRKPRTRKPDKKSNPLQEENANLRYDMLLQSENLKVDCINIHIVF